VRGADLNGAKEKNGGERSSFPLIEGGKPRKIEHRKKAGRGEPATLGLD